MRSLFERLSSWKKAIEAPLDRQDLSLKIEQPKNGSNMSFNIDRGINLQGSVVNCEQDATYSDDSIEENRMNDQCLPVACNNADEKSESITQGDGQSYSHSESADTIDQAEVSQEKETLPSPHLLNCESHKVRNNYLEGASET